MIIYVYIFLGGEMKKQLKPDYIFERIEDIPIDFLKRENIEGILLDVDNTIIAGSKPVSLDIQDWIKAVKTSGIQICILSNTWNMRKVKRLMNTFDIYGLHRASKPAQRGFEMAYNILGIPKNRIAMIGDQIFTDVLGANRFGIRSVFVKPITKFEWVGTLIKRPLESIVLKSIKKEEHK